jgi:hypothetical protein
LTTHADKTNATTTSVKPNLMEKLEKKAALLSAS